MDRRLVTGITSSAVANKYTCVWQINVIKQGKSFCYTNVIQPDRVNCADTVIECLCLWPKNTRIMEKKIWRRFHFLPHLRFGHLSFTHVGCANSMWPSSQIMPNLQKLAAKFNTFHIFGGKPFAKRFGLQKYLVNMKCGGKGRERPGVAHVGRKSLPIAR